MDLPLTDDERRALRRKARSATLEALGALGGEARRRSILSHALEHGGFTRRELEAPSPEVVAHKFDSLVEHQLTWALTHLRRDGLVENPARGRWRLAGAARESVEPAAGAQAIGDRLAQLRAMPYTEYLRTPEWRRARAAALVRAGYSCSLDITHDTDLEVHHRTYERLGAELASDLVVLCRRCHRLHHAEFGRPRRPPTPTPALERTPTPALAAASIAPPDPAAPQARPQLTLVSAPPRRSLLRRLLARSGRS